MYSVFAAYRLLYCFIFVHRRFECGEAMNAGEWNRTCDMRVRNKGRRHLDFLDVFKGLAAQLIVLHHLAFYGPMSDYVRPVAPLLIGRLEMHARIAGHVFLVIGGFLAARSLCPDGVPRPQSALHKKVGQRYLKLAPPFMVARGQLRAWLLPVVVLAGVCASLFWFNRDARFDIWALYFFGSYGIGALAWWASEQQRRATRHMLLAAIVLPATCALLLYFRGRIALALFISCMMAWCARRDKPWRDALPPVSQWLGRIAYSVFLIHFPVCLVVNAAFTR
jgi:peptidoglycan/LPS O-acetylase OafA/YrhL